MINKQERNILTRLVKVVCKLQDPHYMAVNCRFKDKENSQRLVIQCFPVVYCGINHMSLVFPGIHTSFQASVYAKKIQALDKWDTPWYTTQKHWISVLYHPRENTQPYRIQWHPNEYTTAYILIGCIFYGREIHKPSFYCFDNNHSTLVNIKEH